MSAPLRPDARRGELIGAGAVALTITVPRTTLAGEGAHTKLLKIRLAVGCRADG